jgi:tetratricopeptide (TPR) repeat protein
MIRHLHLIGDRQVAREACILLLEPAAVLARCHHRLRGPYTGVDTALSAVLPDALQRSPELVEEHRVELLYGIPELAELIGPAPGTLASDGPFAERTRFFGASMIRCMSQGIVTFLIEYSLRMSEVGRPIPVLAFDGVQDADPTTKEFVALLLRRVDPSYLRVIVGTIGDADGLGPELTGSLAGAERVVAAEPSQASCAQQTEPAALLSAYVDSDCTSDDPAQLDAYRQATATERAYQHDRRAGELEPDIRWGIRVGALAYHREHGSDPGGAGRTALLEALQFCVEVGFSAAVVDLGYRGRAITDPVAEQASFCKFTYQAAAALVPLDRLAESIELYRDLRRRYTLPKVHMTSSYAMAMMYTRFLTPRDHEQALEWQNNAIALASNLPEARDRLIFGVFHDNAMALIEMHRGNLAPALDLINAGIARLDHGLSEHEWVLHRSQLLYNRARLLAGLGRLEEAYNDFCTLTEMDPYYTDYLSERAKISRSRGDLAAAIADYDRAAALAPPFPELYYNRGTAYDELGEPTRALSEFGYVLEMEPDDLPSRLSRAEILLRLGDLDGAQADVEQGLVSRPGDPQLLCMESTILLERGFAELALDRLNTAVGADPNYPAALVNRAMANFQLGRPQQAADDLTATLQLTGDDPDVLLNRGLALRAAGQLQPALADFTRALELPDAELAELRYQRGACFLEAGEPANAEADLRECQRLQYNTDEVDSLLLRL